MSKSAHCTDIYDLIEELQTRLVTKFVNVLLQAQTLQIRHHDMLKGRTTSAETSIGAVDPVRDQDLFIDHNIRPFMAPGDWTFEPCSTHYDTVSASLILKIFIYSRT